MIKAIPTEYKGYRFRSRLEARWAVFFDACGVEWEYEPEGYDLGDGTFYLPDFLLHGVDGRADGDLYVEVKGQMTDEDARKIKRFAEMGMNPDRFGKVYREAVELCAYLCKQFGLTEKDIICHSEGYARGIASNHADVMHWFPKFGKSMDTFRADVKAELESKETMKLDNTAADWSKDAVNWAIKNGLLKGDGTGDLMLYSPLTREQFCVMLKRYHDFQKK